MTQPRPIYKTQWIPPAEVVDNMNRELLLVWLEQTIQNLNEAADEITPWLAQEATFRTNLHGEAIACYPAMNKFYSAITDISRLAKLLRGKPE